MRMGNVEGGHVSLGAFETSLPIRMDIEAALAYLLLPPAGPLHTAHSRSYVQLVAGIHPPREVEADTPVLLRYQWASDYCWVP
jgi:hypothetical protein